jgi:small multidrug resistance family-3 protein
MNIGIALFLLMGAASLEAIGDAVVRMGLHNSIGIKRTFLLLIGGFVLFAYGCLVNSPKWDFGRLIGVYVVFFFIVAQVINWFSFHQKPALPILVGGALIITGGLIISLWKG